MIQLQLISHAFQKLADACASCGLPVKGDCIESNEKVFHPGCMKCYVCGELLNKGVFFTWEDKPICERDYKVSSAGLVGYRDTAYSDTV